MADVTQDDLRRVFDKMDAADQRLEVKIEQAKAEFVSHTATINATLGQISTSVAVMAERLKGVRSDVEDMPEVPPRPCEHFEKHITDHKENTESWKKPLIVGFVATVFIFIQEPVRAWIKGIFTG